MGIHKGRIQRWIKAGLVFVFCYGVSLSDSYSFAATNYVIQTKHTTLVFSSKKDVSKFNDAIDFSEHSGLAALFSSSSSGSVEDELQKKVDKLFVKVQAILDMRKEMRPVKVMVYASTEELHNAFRQIYKRECRIRGWYMFLLNTVFLNVTDVHEGMLAHELGHAIIDNYLPARPPRATSEILARYVDEHLFEEVIQY